MINFDSIRPNLFIGSCPYGPMDARHMSQALGITAVLNLQTDDDFQRWDVKWEALQQAYETNQVYLTRCPITDFDRGDLEQRVLDAAQLLDGLLAVGHRVYVHCTAGMERAPATVISYLVRFDAMSLDDAFLEVTSQRSCSPYTDVLERVLDQQLTIEKSA